MNDIKSSEVLEVISKHVGLELSAIFLNSRLEHDLGCTGDDAHELLEEIRDIYNVDFSGINIDDYISPEVEGFLAHLFNRAQLQHRSAFPITIQHLMDIINKGKWFAPPQVRKI